MAAAGVSSLIPSLAASTGVRVGALEVLGARVYDPGTRGFLSRDPLVSPTGAGWASNVYAFAGFDPVGLVDPWGLTPVSREEFAQYAAEHPSPSLKSWANEHADQIAAVAIGVGVVVGAVALIATGPVGLIVAGAVSGAALSGGLSILTNKNEDGTVNWGKVGKDALIGLASGAVGGGAVSVVSKVGAVFNGARATRAGVKATTLGQKSSAASRVNPMKYVNSWRAERARRQSSALRSRAAGFSQRSDYYDDAGGYARSLSGQTVNGVSSNVVSNNLAYATGDFEDRSVLGHVRATASGVGVGLVSPRITPVRTNLYNKIPVAGEGVNSVAGFATDRGADYVTGVANYAVTPQEKDLNLEDAKKEGFKSMVSGGSGVASTGIADGARPATGS